MTKPITTEIKQINHQLLSKDMANVLLCSSSFDARCLAVPSQFSDSDFNHVIVSQYLSNADETKDNLAKILSRFPKSACMCLDIDDPITSADSIRDKLSDSLDFTVSSNILFDITCFTRESLLMILAYLRTCNLRQSKLVFLYSHANKYKTPLSKGIKEVRSVLGFSGMLRPARKNHLIILAGYEDSRAISIVMDFEPQFVSIGIGSPEQPPAHYSKAKEAFESLVRRIPNANQFEFDAYNPISTARIIEKEAKRYENSNIIVAPMNTKISAIGAALFALKCPYVQICYASAETYFFDSVTAGEDCTLFELPEFLSVRSPNQ